MKHETNDYANGLLHEWLNRQQSYTIRSESVPPRDKQSIATPRPGIKAPSLRDSDYFTANISGLRFR